MINNFEELDGPKVRALGVQSRKLSNATVIGWETKIYYRERLRAAEGTLSR
jgi:hypothetical protein